VLFQLAYDFIRFGGANLWFGIDFSIRPTCLSSRIEKAMKPPPPSPKKVYGFQQKLAQNTIKTFFF
jgi:hypothetical protein